MKCFKDYADCCGETEWNEVYRKYLDWMERNDLYADDELETRFQQVVKNASKLSRELLAKLGKSIHEAREAEIEKIRARRLEEAKQLDLNMSCCMSISFDEEEAVEKKSTVKFSVKKAPVKPVEEDHRVCMSYKMESAIPGRSLKDLNGELEDGFSVSLLKHIARKGLNEVEVYKKAGVDRKLFSKIKKNPDYQPKKSTALAFAFALGLNLDETKDFIARAGYALTRSRVADVIILEFLDANDHDLDKLNAMLYEFHQPLIGF